MAITQSRPIVSFIESNIPDRKLYELMLAAQQEMLVIVDPMSTGATLAFEASSRGVPICCVWSDVCPESLRHFVADGQEVKFTGIVQHDGDLKKTIEGISKVGNATNVIVGSEPGVELADALAAALKVRGNGIEQSATRRNKYEQSEACRAAGLAAGAQSLVTTIAEVESFLAAHCVPFTKLVVKPCDGAASEGVTICSSADQVRKAFSALQGTTNVFGRANAQVLLMEYLGGDEFVVDTVSRDGVHKCVAIWKYIKKPLNGASNVFYGQRLKRVDPSEEDGEALARMAKYIFGVLDAIGIKHGAVHSEVKLDTSTPALSARGPVLIESNCRLHGIEGSWKPIVDACFGYSQVSSLLDAYFSPAAFAALPTTPCKMQASGAQVGVRSTVEGIISRVNAERMAAIRGVESYRGENLPASLKAGATISKTIDIVTLCGQINLVHASKARLEEDMETVQQLIDAGIFEVKIDSPKIEPLEGPKRLVRALRLSH